MPRTTIAPQTMKNIYAGSPAANALDFTLTAADVANGNQYVCTGREVLIVYNSDGANPYTFTLGSVVDPYGRTQDLTAYSLAAGEYAALPVPSVGFKQTDGYAYINGSNAAIKFAILVMP